MAEKVYKIGIENAVEYVPGYIPGNAGTTQTPKSDAAISYNGAKVESEQPLLLRIEQGLAQLLDGINGAFTGATNAVNGFIKFFINNWQLVVVALVALIIAGKK